MRYLAFLAVPLVLAAQSVEPDQRITQTLISEIQQLRIAIERSTLLNARTQLAISQLQMQEATVTRLSAEHEEARTKERGLAAQHTALGERIAELQSRRSAVDLQPKQRDDIDASIKNMKAEQEQLALWQPQQSAREGEIASQLQAAQKQIADSRTRIADMERALDTAIQQLLKQK
jgi:hypothetical protein